MADEAIDSLFETSIQILKQHHRSHIRRHIISINTECVALQYRPRNNSEILEEQIRDAATSTKEMIEYFLSEENPLYGGRMTPTVEHSNQLKGVAENFKSTVQNLLTPGDAVNAERPLQDVSPFASSSRRTATTNKDVIVGFNEDLIDLKNRITGSNQQSQLQVLSIVGTGGIGKTTLAKLVYNDQSIVKHFNIRAWVSVSHDYSVASVVFNLLASLEEGGIPIERNGQNEASIKAHLNHEKFLIVMDDVCSKKAWDDLKTLFPHTGSSSRIILTTRLHEVADYVNSSIPVHFIRFLDPHDSWDLLKKKVFVDESCPIQLEDVGRKILKICGGLPLSIVMVAGILSMLPKTRFSWKQYAVNHGTLETIITLSYNHLPDYMRECFLYMGGFPEDYEIRVSEIIKLWIDEGFLKCPTRSMTISLEEEATKVLDSLVERSLVLVGKRKFDGKIKSCTLHDIVRDFCIREAQREKFLLSVMDYLPTPILRRHFLPRLIKSFCRISASSHDLDLKDSMHSSSTRSIICIPRRGFKCVSSMHKFSSLKVFHVLRRYGNWEWEPNQVLDLVYLTYIASNIPIIPSTITKLKNLQTLNIYRYEVVLPVEIWKLRQLRHLMALSFDSLPQPNAETLPLEKLQVMSLVIDLMCSERMMEMIPNIKKLEICSRGFKDYDLCNLGYLQELEKLKLVSLEKHQYDNQWKNPIFPPSLKKLTLCGLRLPWKEMRIISSLPSLQMLKLRNFACDGTVWGTTAGEFKQLEFLLVDESCLAKWLTKSSDFPKLKSLVLHRCPYLREIPCDIGNISTLELITVDSSEDSLVRSAMMIQRDQRRKGNYNIEVCYSNAFLTQQGGLVKDWSCSPAFSSSSSFYHLPRHLQESFLYMSVFPNDYEIRVSEIIKLCVAQGFLRHQTETRSLEEEAEDCLDDLVQRRLLLVTSRKADGKIKSFRLHENVRVNFPSRAFQRITVPCIPPDALSLKERLVSVRDFTPLWLLHFLRSNTRSYWDLGEVFDDIHLTYLATNIPSSIVPPAISQLQNLQTLIIYKHGVNLPVEIWKMPQLRHLMAFSFHPLPDPEDADTPLENLQTLSLATDFVCNERMLVMIPNIRKLGVCYYGGNAEGDYHLDNISQLLQLKKLKLEIHASFRPNLPIFPRSLKKLNLSRVGFPWRDMKIIGSLPNLQVLKLRNHACDGEDWETADGEFYNLRFLLIDESNLVNWTTESSHFPSLNCLMLHRCPYLSEIPYCIGHISTLEWIEVDDFNESIVNSARRMYTEQQEDFGRDNLELHMRHFDTHSQTLGPCRHENVRAPKAYYCSYLTKLIVYDYSPQGSVFDMLKPGLNWETRVKIAAGAALGIAHIHAQSVFHGNIKSSNIFVNSQGYGCVSEFGLAGMMKKKSAGEKADVYNFGLLLLELVTGQSPVEVRLVDRVRFFYPCAGMYTTS